MPKTPIKLSDASKTPSKTPSRRTILKDKSPSVSKTPKRLTKVSQNVCVECKTPRRSMRLVQSHILNNEITPKLRQQKFKHQTQSAAKILAKDTKTKKIAKRRHSVDDLKLNQVTTSNAEITDNEIHRRTLFCVGEEQNDDRNKETTINCVQSDASSANDLNGFNFTINETDTETVVTKEDTPILSVSETEKCDTPLTPIANSVEVTERIIEIRALVNDENNGIIAEIELPEDRVNKSENHLVIDGETEDISTDDQKENQTFEIVDESDEEIDENVSVKREISNDSTPIILSKSILKLARPSIVDLTDSITNDNELIEITDTPEHKLRDLISEKPVIDAISSPLLNEDTELNNDCAKEDIGIPMSSAEPEIKINSTPKITRKNDPIEIIDTPENVTTDSPTTIVVQKLSDKISTPGSVVKNDYTALQNFILKKTPKRLQFSRQQLFSKDAKNSTKKSVQKNLQSIAMPSPLKGIRKRSFSVTDVEKKNVTFREDPMVFEEKALIEQRPQMRKRSLSVVENGVAVKKTLFRDISSGVDSKSAKRGVSKIPDFASIHNRQFKRMESLTDYTLRKNARAKVLLSAHKSQSNATSSASKPTFSIASKCLFKFGAENKTDYNIIYKPSAIETDKAKNGESKHTSLYKERPKVDLATQRTTRSKIIKGVRSNRRFELQMKYRKALEDNKN